MFKLSHLASKIGDDKHCARTVTTHLASGKHYIVVSSSKPVVKPGPKPKADAEVISKDDILLTEAGAYAYLMKSNREEAIPFVDWVTGELTKIRKIEIDESKLREKIAVKQSEFALEAMISARVEVTAAKLILKQSPVTKYTREPHHSEADMLNHAINKWFTQQVIHNDVLFNRCIISAELMAKIYDMAALYFDMDKHDEHYDDLFPILCQLYRVEYDGKVIPRNKKMRFVPAS
jgi:hypothetical protein